MFKAKMMGGTTPQPVLLIGFLFSELNELLTYPVQDVVEGSQDTQLVSGLLVEMGSGQGDDAENIAFVVTARGMYCPKAAVMHQGKEVVASVCGLNTETIKALLEGNLVTTPHRPWVVMIARETLPRLLTFATALASRFDELIDALEQKTKSKIPEPSLN